MRVTYLTLVILFASSGLLLEVHAVSPTPDGGYPDFATVDSGVGWGSSF